MTYDSTKGFVLGSCPYGCGYFDDSSSWSGREIYHPLPLNVTNLNHEMCRRLNRDYINCAANALKASAPYSTHMT